MIAALHIRGFNRTVWNTLWILIPMSCVVLCLAARAVKSGNSYLFDPKHQQDEKLRAEGGDFERHLQRYQDLAKLIITLSTGVVAFLINTLANAKEPLPQIVSKLQWSAPIIVGFFGFSIGSLILFMVSQTIWYEEYCHSVEHNSYGRWKYISSNFLGYDGLLSFIAGVLWLATNIFT